jgi:GPH family glycoside/pentoside/hexuronide:cation symporter
LAAEGEMMDIASQARAPRRPGFSAYAAIGIGAVSSGIVTQALTSLALLFYNQVVGLSATAVGLALMLSLVGDAFWDPAIGLWSDSTRSRLGRRHPFMYASVIPTGLAFWALWNPPAGLSDSGNFVYLLVTIMSVRFFSSLYEVPATSLIPEIAPDYDKRTGFVSVLYFGGVSGLVLASVLAFQIFLSDRVGGVHNLAGYGRFGLWCGFLISIAFLLATLGTHRQIPYLASPPESSGGTKLRQAFSQVVAAFSNRNFLAIMVASLLSGLSGGISNTLNTYFNVYFWGLSTNQLSGLALPVLFASIVSVVIAPVLTRRYDKKRVAMFGLGLAIVAAVLPIGLRLLGILPGNNWPWLMPFLVVEIFLASMLGLIGLIAITSMLADVVEDNAVRSGYRSEGLFFSANSLINKCITGLGMLLAGMMLTFVNFPANAKPGQISAVLMHQLGMIYVPIGLALGVLSILAIGYFRIDRAQHEANLSQLRSVATAEVGTIESVGPSEPTTAPPGGVPGLAAGVPRG